jgi:hypothetical protein
MKRDAKTGQEGICQRWLGNLVRKDLDATGKRYILAFSTIFALNIAIGNASLQHVSVNFNQVMRSLVPALTIIFGLCAGQSISKGRILAVLPVILGVAMACFGDMTYSSLGFVYTCGCVLLAAIKVVAAGQMLTGTLKLHPVDLLGYLAPLAMMQCLAFSLATGEIKDMVSSGLGLDRRGMFPLAVVVLSGILSFGLNITSLMVNKLTSPLTLCIGGNVKQVLMIAMSTIIFATPITPLNGWGIAVVLFGSSLYSYVSVSEKLRSVNEGPILNEGESRQSTDSKDGDELDSIERGEEDSEDIRLLQISTSATTKSH